MTISQDPAGATPLARVIVRPAAIDEYTPEAYCPVCGNRVEDTEGEHDVPITVVDIQEMDVVADGGESVSLYGYRCDRHRHPHVLIAPAAIAPTGYDRVSLDLADGFEAAIGGGDTR